MTTFIGTRKRFWETRRGLAAVATLAVLAVASVAVYAQFATSGSPPSAPSGPATGVATASPTTVGSLTPQLNPADTTPVSVSVEDAGPGAASLGVISGAVVGAAGCPGSWFTVAPVAAPGTVGPGRHTYASSVILNDNDRDQSACLGKTFTIDWTIARAASSASP